MSDISITAANVVASGGATIDRSANAGASITAGQVVYKDDTTGTWKLADNNSATAEAKTPEGIALNGAASGQPLAVATAGDITIGGTLTAGSPYYLSGTAGGIAPAADLASGMNVCLLGLAKSTTVLTLRIQAPGVTL
jgi:hypothetical protein